ncbi:MAG: GLPGLI family protein [Leeuwenhoekiella sp.]
MIVNSLYQFLFVMIFILSSGKVFSQIKNGRVIYTVSFNKEAALKELDSMHITDPFVRAGLKEYYEFADDVTMQLDFSEEYSRFHGERSLESDNAKTSAFMAIMSGLSSNTYVNLNTGEVYKDTDVLAGVLIKQPPLKWNLTRETKTIANYTCYKAMAIWEITTSSGERKHKLEAWYTPDIPLSLGPYLFTGLPGVILELHVPKQNLIFKAESLDLNPPVPEEVNFPDKKIISQEEADNILRGYLKDVKN